MSNENYIFYDTEGTGTHARYDTPLQYAAIRTNDKFETVEEINIRCRLPKHIVPHPQALFVTHVNPYDIDKDAMSPYEFASAINAFQGKRANTVFVGQNILKYDEEIMRTLMWMNMQDPYVSSRKDSRRIDTLPMLQIMHALAPGFIKTNLNNNGNHVFKLDQVAPLNGFDEHNAHDALGDDRATIFMFKLMQKRKPELFNMAIQLTYPDKVDDMFTKARENGEPLYYMLHYGKPEWKCVYPIAKFQKKWGVIDLTQDTRFWSQCNGTQWFNRAYPYLNKEQGTLPGFAPSAPSEEDKLASRAFQSIAINKQPTIVSRSMLEAAGIDPKSLGIADMPDTQILKERIESLQRPVVALAAQSAMEKQSKAFAPSLNIEEKIYAGFPSWADKDLMARFRDAKDWDVRKNIMSSFKMDNLRQIGTRILFEEAPELLKTAPQIEKAIIQRRLYAEPAQGESHDSIPWTTIPAATDAAIALHKEHNTPETANILQWYKDQDQYWRARLEDIENTNEKTQNTR